MSKKKAETSHAGEFMYKGYKCYRYPAAPNLWCCEDPIYHVVVKIYCEKSMLLGWIDEEVSKEKN